MNQNHLIIAAHWRNARGLRADEEYLTMKIEEACDKCGKDLSAEPPETLHANFKYDRFMCDACYQARLEAICAK